METVDNPYKWRQRVSPKHFGTERLTFSAIHPNGDLGAVATLNGGVPALPERSIVWSDTGEGTPERVFAPDVKPTRAMTKAEEDKQSDFERRHSGGRPMYQGTLFDTRPPEEAKAPTLGVLASTVGESHLVPAILGLAGHESMRRYGKLPIPDSSLSHDSARIVQRLVRNGVIDPHPDNPESKPSNDLSRLMDPGFPTEVVHAERGFIADALRNHANAQMRGEDPGPSPVTEVDPMIGSQFVRQRLVEAKRAREGR